MGPTPPPVEYYRVILGGVMRPGLGVAHPPPPNAKDKERIGLDLCSLSVPSWHVLGWTSPFYLLRFVYNAVTQENVTGEVTKTSGVLGFREKKWSPSVSYMRSYGEWHNWWSL